MADLDTNMKIIVEAVADEQSAKNAAKKLASAAAKETKKGYIELSTKATAPFELKSGKKGTKQQLNAISKLNKAQSELVDQWSKQSEKGFRSSAGYMEDLAKKYKVYKEAVKGRNETEQNKEIVSVIGTALQPYFKWTSQLETRLKKIKQEAVKAAKLEEKRNPRFKHTKEEIDANIEQKRQAGRRKFQQVHAEEFAELRETREGRQYDTPTSRFYGRIDPRLLHLSNRGGGHGSKMASTQTLNNIRAKKDPVFTKIDEKMATKRQLAGIRRQHAAIIAKDEKTGNKLKTQSENDINYKGFLNSFKKEFSNFTQGKDKIEAQDVLNKLGAYLLNSQQLQAKRGIINVDAQLTKADLKRSKYGPSSTVISKSIKDIQDYVKPMTNMLSELGLPNKISGFLGLAGSNKKDKQINVEEANNIVKVLLKEIGKKFPTADELANAMSVSKGKISPYQQRRNELNETDEFNDKKSELAKTFKEVSNTSKNTNNLIKQSTAVAKSTTDSVKNVASTANALESTNDMNYVQDVRASGAEQISDEKALQEQTKLAEINAEDMRTGGNTDANFGAVTSLLQHMDEVVSSIYTNTDSLAANLRDIVGGKRINISGGKGGKGGKKKDESIGEPSGNLPDLYRAFDAEGKWRPSKVITHKQGIREKGTEKARLALEKSLIKERAAEEQKRLKEITEQVEVGRLDAFVEHIQDLMYESREKLIADRPRPSEKEEETRPVSNLRAKAVGSSIFNQLREIFKNISPAGINANKILQMNKEQQKDLLAARRSTFGLAEGDDAGATGAKSRMFYRKSMYGWKDVQNPFKNLKLTDGIDIDVTQVTEKLQKSIEKNMFKAQTGGIGRNLLIAGTGGLASIFMPSLEKTRAQIDGLNQILSDERTKLQTVVDSIKVKEATLQGLADRGEAKFKTDDTLAEGSSEEAFKLFADMEEQKYQLEGILADIGVAEQISKRTFGNTKAIIRLLGYASPELQKDNAILRNISAGLDKNGKALKYQTRFAEILSYTFQRIARSIGQMLKNWLFMLNPINLIKKAVSGIRRLFQDFGSYDVKWQRTMNVIKINFQRILKPAMQWIAQKLVNVIGFLDIISMKIQAAFGMLPISVFDKAGAMTEKIKRDLEEAQDVTAGFDEFHPIGESYTGANNLLGDIYEPQLSEKWKNLANEIGDLFAGLITGDLGFGEVMKKILELAKNTIGLIWDEFKKTTIGKWITDNWKTLLDKLLQIFLAWELLKIAGKLIWNAFTSSLTGDAFGNLLSGLFGGTGFAQGMGLALQSLFAGGKYSLLGTIGEMLTNSEAITQAGSWGSMIGFAIAKALVAALSIALGGKMLGEAIDSASDKRDYNLGLEKAGGKEEDKKGYRMGYSKRCCRWCCYWIWYWSNNTSNWSSSWSCCRSGRWSINNGISSSI